MGSKARRDENAHMAEIKLSDPVEYSDETPDSSAQSTITNQGKDLPYSWVILFGSFMVQVIAVGLALSSGAFTPTLIEHFGEDRTAVAWVGSLHTGFIFFGGPVTGILTKRFGHRVIVMSGALMSVVGLGLSSLATDVRILYITYGCLAGLGFSFSYIPAVTILAASFHHWQHVAFSVSNMGAGVGVLIMPYAIKYFISEFGIQGAYILVAGLALQLLVCGALFRAPDVPIQEKTMTIRQELSILCDWRFNILLVNNYLYNFGSLIVFVFIADHAQHLGMTASQGIFLISLLGISNAVGRAFVSFLSIWNINNTIVYTIACIISGVAVSAIPIPVPCPGTCLYVVAVCCILYGLFFGMQLANLAIVANQLVGTQRLNAAYGAVMFINGAGAATGPPFAGFLYSQSGSYEIGYYVAGATIITAGLLMLPVILVRKPQLPTEIGNVTFQTDELEQCPMLNSKI